MTHSAPAKAGDPLTPTDLDTLRLVANGRTAEQIAHELHVSYHTISTRLGQIYRKLNVTDRTSAVVTAHQTGMLSLACPPRALDLTELREQLAAVTARAEQAEQHAERLQARLNATEWDAQARLIEAQRRQLDSLRVLAGPADTPAAEEEPHVCKPGATTYFCPTAGETESSCHGGFGTCCDAPELHQLVEQAPAVACDHRDPKRLAARPYDLAVYCACGTQVMSGIRAPLQTEQAKSFAADIEAAFIEPFARAAAARREAAAPSCCVCGTYTNGGRAFYENYQGRLFCWPCADGRQPVCPLGGQCDGVDCPRRADHGPRPSGQPAATTSLDGLDVDALTQLIHAAAYRRAEIDPDQCPAECAEGHTYKAPCSSYYPNSGDEPEGEPGLPDEPAHDPCVWERDGQWNAACNGCDEAEYDIGSEHDGEQWAERHLAAAAQKPAGYCPTCEGQPRAAS